MDLSRGNWCRRGNWASAGEACGKAIDHQAPGSKRILPSVLKSKWHAGTQMQRTGAEEHQEHSVPPITSPSHGEVSKVTAEVKNPIWEKVRWSYIYCCPSITDSILRMQTNETWPLASSAPLFNVRDDGQVNASGPEEVMKGNSSQALKGPGRIGKGDGYAPPGCGTRFPFRSSGCTVTGF